jgi:hypothetical protein
MSCRPAGCRCVRHCRRTQRCPESYCVPADGTSAAKLKKQRLRFVAVLWAALRQAIRLTVPARYASRGSLSIKMSDAGRADAPRLNEKCHVGFWPDANMPRCHPKSALGSKADITRQWDSRSFERTIWNIVISGLPRLMATADVISAAIEAYERINRPQRTRLNSTHRATAAR